MPRLILTALLLLTPFAVAADDLRITQMEQDIRDLKRQVQTLTRQIEELRRHAGKSGCRARALAFTQRIRVDRMGGPWPVEPTASGHERDGSAQRPGAADDDAR